MTSTNRYMSLRSQFSLGKQSLPDGDCFPIGRNDAFFAKKYLAQI
ncbi:hypothetical protein [Fortiea sp. LEGE XX443]